MSRRKAGVRPARIGDVARLAGVSVATVSRALALPDVVSPDTRKRVLEAVRATGYTPNIAARSLRARKSMMALVVVPDIANSFFSEVLRGIDETLSQAGYGIIIANLAHSAAKEARYVDLAFAGQVDGAVLLCGHVLRGRDRDLADANLPMVAACERIPGLDIPQVEADNRDAARAAVAHLIGLGHRDIAYLSGPADNILEHDRRDGYRQAMAEAGLAVRDDRMLSGDFSFQAGERAAQALLALPARRRPTALFAANDEMAIGFLKTARLGGLGVPDDMSVVGFDGIAFADFCEPTLTTVFQPRRELGARAAALLIARMRGEAGRAGGVEQTPARLLPRQSSAPPPRRRRVMPPATPAPCRD